MILFCDTSALVKLYVHEDGTEVMMEQAGAAEVLAVCRLAWVEALAAVARRSREQRRNAAALDVARGRFIVDWPSYLKMEVTQELVELAAEYADAFALRAYDSVQLASVRAVQEELPGDVRFACFDSRLVKAARMLGIDTVQASVPG